MKKIVLIICLVGLLSSVGCQEEARVITWNNNPEVMEKYLEYELDYPLCAGSEDLPMIVPIFGIKF